MVICEPICEGMEHVPFNSQIINQILINKPDEVIRLICSESHWQGLKPYIRAENINRVVFIQIDKVSCKTEIFQWCIQVFFLFKISRYSLKNESWLFLTTTVPIYWWLCHFFKKHKPTVVFHSVLAEVEGWVPKNPIRRFFSLNKTFSLFAGCSPNIVVLEQYIKNNLIALFPKLEKKINIIPHPLPADVIPAEKKQSGIVRVGFPGGFSSNKGAASFVKLAEKFQDKVEFVVIGKNYLSNSTESLSKHFQVGPFVEFLTRESYSEEVGKCDFIFLSQSDEHYKWTASGVILDALHFEKPLIALKSSNLAAITNNSWDIGYFYSSFDELSRIMEEIIATPQLPFIETKVRIIERKKGRLIEYNQAVSKL